MTPVLLFLIGGVPPRPWALPPPPRRKVLGTYTPPQSGSTGGLLGDSLFPAGEYQPGPPGESPTETSATLGRVPATPPSPRARRQPRGPLSLPFQPSSRSPCPPSSPSQEPRVLDHVHLYGAREKAPYLGKVQSRRRVRDIGL